MSFCPECGVKVEEDVQFCGNCGSSIQVSPAKPAVSKVQASNYQQPPQQGYQQPPQQGYQQPPQQGYQRPPQQGYQQPPQQSYQQPQQFMAARKDPSLATILTIFIPGFAHFYNDRIGEGILFLLLTPFLYIFVIGFFLHLYLIFTAGGMTKETNMRNGYTI